MIKKILPLFLLLLVSCAPASEPITPQDFITLPYVLPGIQLFQVSDVPQRISWYSDSQINLETFDVGVIGDLGEVGVAVFDVSSKYLFDITYLSVIEKQNGVLQELGGTVIDTNLDIRYLNIRDDGIDIIFTELGYEATLYSRPIQTIYRRYELIDGYLIFVDEHDVCMGQYVLSIGGTSNIGHAVCGEYQTIPEQDSLIMFNNGWHRLNYGFYKLDLFSITLDGSMIANIIYNGGGSGHFNMLHYYEAYNEDWINPAHYDLGDRIRVYYLEIIGDEVIVIGMFHDGEEKNCCGCCPSVPVFRRYQIQPEELILIYEEELSPYLEHPIPTVAP